MTESTCRASLSSTNQSLDSQDVLRIHITLFLRCKERLDFLILLDNHLVFRITEELVETIDKVHETSNFLIANGNITTRFVSNMYFMTLRHQSLNGSSHGNDIIIRMGREYQYTFGEWSCTFWSIRIIRIRLSAWPSRNRMLQVIKYLDVGIICRTIQCKQFTQAIFIVILIG